MTAATEAALRALEEAVRSAHPRSTLGEAALLPVFRALGWRTPIMATVAPGEEPPALDAWSGDRVVLKLLAPGLAHRTEVGGVRVVARTPEAVREALACLRSIEGGEEAPIGIQEWIAHDQEPGGELLLGARWTEEFGVVVTLGPGGVTAEHLAALVSAQGGVLHVAAGRAAHRNGAGAPLSSDHPLVPLALGTLRGRAGRAGAADLAGALERFSSFADAAVPGLVSELEVNPLAFVRGEPVVLDALARVGDGTSPDRPGEMPPWRRDAVHALLRPRTVALIGVSRRENPGRTILRNLLRMGFPSDAVRIVKPGLDTLDGCRCVPDVEALDPPADLLVVSVGAADVPSLLERVVRGRRARSVVLVSGGLGEAGENRDGAEAVDRLLREAGADAPVVNGGNCLGVRSWPGRCDTLFIPPSRVDFPDGPPHPLALVSQSGAFAIARASALPWLHPRYVVTVGNQLDLTVGEYLEVLADDPEVRVFACYVEGFRPGDGLRFLSAARRLAREGRPVILYRAGRTKRGAEAAVSHTASLAGDYAVTRALAREAGVLVADRLDDFDDLVRVATLLERRSVGSRVGVMSNAGFECVALADAAGSLELAQLSAPTLEALGSLLASRGLDGIVAPRNPLDVTPILDDDAFARAAAAVLDDPAVDVGIVGCVPLTPALRTKPDEGAGPDGGVLDGLRALWTRTHEAWIAVVDGGPGYDAFAAGLEGAGIPVFRRGDRAMAALARYVAWRRVHGSASTGACWQVAEEGEYPARVALSRVQVRNDDES